MNMKRGSIILLYSELPKFFLKNTTRRHTDSITISTTVNIKIDTVYIQNKTKQKTQNFSMTIGID